jgi:hypothetical protein
MSLNFTAKLQYLTIYTLENSFRKFLKEQSEKLREKGLAWLGLACT